MIIKILIYCFIFLAVFLFGYVMMRKGSEESSRRALGILNKPKVVRSPVIRLLRPLFPLLLPLTKRLQNADRRRKRQQQFVLAGMTDEIVPEEFLAFQILAATLAFLVLLVIKQKDIGLVSSFLAILLGFLFPAKWLKDRIAMRSEAMLRELPQVVDILALSTRAGLGFIAGLERLIQKRETTPLMEEIKVLLQEMQMGTTREQALRNMANRCEAPEINQFIVVLIQASNLGVPISNVLAAQSEKMRTERFQRAERKGAAATQKILFPLIFLIMPAVMIVVLGPIVITYLAN